MRDLKEIRFVATNFSNLQGLRAIPLGLCLLLVCLWVNGLHGKATNFLVPISVLIASAVLLFAIDRYYLHTFGRVQRTPESRRMEWVVTAVGGVLALIAVWLDMTRKLPLSLVGLVFAAGLLADYIRITWLVRGRFLLYYPLEAVLMAGLSLLPLLGLPGWWQAIGLKSQIVGIAVAIGIFTLIAGIWGHIYLVRTFMRPLPPSQEN